ncbi:type 1 fimbrial protein [Stenotrophomonas cyclobalanopsidis]|uniref:Type 1 fimbrial protein n=2 Tax=Stenotrophomonas cyclobalanopsidis TaxID=2771362 RepID=A0ABQ6T3H0_9GAMM|nr:type 1 fimbrial protein [Stenotrophomonas cyclobalanopsidis]
MTIDLGTLPAGAIPRVGAEGPESRRELVSGGCVGVASVDMTFQGTASGDDLGAFAVEGGASGVGVILRTEDGRAIVPNSTVPLTFSRLPAGESYKFLARYRNVSGKIVAGDANAKGTVVFTYR